MPGPIVPFQMRHRSSHYHTSVTALGILPLVRVYIMCVVVGRKMRGEFVLNPFSCALSYVLFLDSVLEYSGHVTTAPPGPAFTLTQHAYHKTESFHLKPLEP